MDEERDKRIYKLNHDPIYLRAGVAYGQMEVVYLYYLACGLHIFLKSFQRQYCLLYH